MTTTAHLPGATRALAALVALALGTGPLAAQSLGDGGTLLEIGPGSGGFGGSVHPGDLFGAAVTSPGDLDGDSATDFVFGAPGDDQGGPNTGAAWVLFSDPEAGVSGWTKIAHGSGGLGPVLPNKARFGTALAALGDLDGNGVGDVVVGAPGPSHGFAWVLRLATDGSVLAATKLGEPDDGSSDDIKDFGRALCAVGDVDGDGVVDLIVGSLGNDHDESSQDVRLHLQLLNADGSSKSLSSLDLGSDALLLTPSSANGFGDALAAVGDVDGNGVPDFAVGAPRDDDGASDAGAVWIVFLAPGGGVLGTQKLSSTQGDGPALGAGDRFGTSLAGVGDVDADGRPDLLVGAPGDDTGGPGRGAAWLLSLDTDGSVLAATHFASTPDGPLADLPDGGAFGSAVGSAGDVDQNGRADLLVGNAGGSAYLVLLPGLDAGATPYVPSAAVFAGEAGRSALVPVVQGGGSGDFIDEPVVVVTNKSEDVVDLRLGSSSSSHALSFDGAGEIPVGSAPNDVATGSFHGGLGFGGVVGTLADLVVANQGGDSISLLRALPGGTYAPHVEFSLAPENSAPVALEVGDFDGDGAFDVAVAGAQGVTVLLGDDMGGFPARRFVALPWLTDLEAGFVDGDAVLDLVTTSGRPVTASQPTEEGFATTLLGLGDGGFSVAGQFASGHALASVLLADFDGDALQDSLLVAHRLAGAGGLPEGRIELHLGDGAGGFVASPVFAGYTAPDAQGVHPTLGTVGDLDGDGWLDAVYSSNDSLAFPPGTFADEQPPVVLTVLRNDQAGGFAVDALGTAYAGKGVAPILADVILDELGLNDAILIWSEDVGAGLGGSGDSGLTTFLTAFASDGDAGFFDPSATQFATGMSPANGRVAEIDTSGPTRLDVLVPNLADDSLTLLVGDGEGGVRETILLEHVGPIGVGDLPPGDWIGGPREVELAQTNGDSLLDAFVYSAWEDRSGRHPEVHASLVLVDSAASAVAQTLPLPRGGEFALADVTGDGRADALLTQRLGPGAFEGLHVYVGLPSGLLDTTPLAIPAPAGSTLAGGLAARDLDGDGRPEVVTTAHDAQGALTLLVADFAAPQPAFEASSLGGVQGAVRSVALGDLDGDGALDAAVGLRDGRLRVARGGAGNAFSIAALDSQAAKVGGGALALGDVNGDGRLDIVSSTAAAPGAVDQAFVRVLLGQGGGAFALGNVDALQSTGPIGALRPLLADMDNDGALDLVLVHGTSNAVSILLNQLNDFRVYGSGKPGSGGFTPRLAATGFSTPGSGFTVRVDKALGQAVGVLAVGFGEVVPAPFHVGSILVFLPLNLGGTAGLAGGGAAQRSFLVPDDAAFVGLELSMQALILDPGAGAPAPFSLATSNGLTLTVVE